MNEPTIEAVIQRLDRLEQGNRKLKQFVLLLLIGVVALSISAFTISQNGRYQIGVSDGGVIYRVDTATGEVKSFGQGRDRFKELATLPPVGKETHQ